MRMTLDLLLKLMDEAGAHEALITTCSLKRPLMQESALKQQLLLLPLSHDALAVHHRVHKRTSTSDKLHLASFQEELHTLWAKAASATAQQEARQELLLKHLCPIVTRYGFEASWEGVVQSQLSAGPWATDAEVTAKYMLQKWLLDPRLQARRIPGMKEGLEMYLAIRELCQEIEARSGRPSLAAPLCSVRQAIAASQLQQVPVPWARVLAPAVCAVIPRVLTNEEVQALKSWGMSRRDWVSANGHMISQFVDPVLADKLWSRVCHLVPSFKGLGAVGLNQHMRFLKYGKGHFFAPHQDGENRHGAARSLLSALLYLSGVDSNESGGGTRFISPECPEVARTGRCDRACDHCVDAPVAAGCLLVFAQSLVHAGTEPMSSDKFVIRTDVMYPVAET
ncbi:unnamed protein product [Symbiodinium natans]|uniref:Prolyl 4-hydroxylase alpha subunit Fe(2+) 2OG dioxygenase domain-containing protein n=1 Tax=Symbiodinium natans TaxID=878477 RepID=A0A812IGZ3_9DINO|nr:unnamed protein product [Symbiodinium natans]